MTGSHYPRCSDRQKTEDVSLNANIFSLHAGEFVHLSSVLPQTEVFTGDKYWELHLQEIFLLETFWFHFARMCLDRSSYIGIESLMKRVKYSLVPTPSCFPLKRTVAKETEKAADLFFFVRQTAKLAHLNSTQNLLCVSVTSWFSQTSIWNSMSSGKLCNVREWCYNHGRWRELLAFHALFMNHTQWLTELESCKNEELVQKEVDEDWIWIHPCLIVSFQIFSGVFWGVQKEDGCHLTRHQCKNPDTTEEFYLQTFWSPFPLENVASNFHRLN